MYFIDLKRTYKWFVDFGVECSTRSIRFSAPNVPAGFDGTEMWSLSGRGIVRAMTNMS